MILLWGVPRDDPLAAVHRALQKTGTPVVVLDQIQLVAGQIEVETREGVATKIAAEAGELSLGDVTAAYLRPYDSRRIFAPRATTDAARVEAAEQALTLWSETTTATVVNRPSAMASNNSKPYQLQLIHKHGFDVPDTLVTTDPAAAEAFRREHGTVIYKSVSGIRSVVSRLRDADRPRLDTIANCPTQFQQHITGVDVRVHVVGNTTFACEIRSDADDYRHPQHQTSLDVAGIGLSLEQQLRCRRLAHSLGLHLAGIDLRVTGAGAWYCFEVNPSPGFTFYEESTGQPIADAIADLLRGAE